MAPINRGFLTAGILTVIGTPRSRSVYVGNDEGTALNRSERRDGACSVRSSPASCSRRSSSRITEYFTSTETDARPGHRRGRPHRPGHHRARRHLVAASSRRCGPSSPSPSRSAPPLRSAAATSSSPLYLVALTGMGMLATTGVVVSEDTFGPVADNAAGIAEMSGEFER